MVSSNQESMRSIPSIDSIGSNQKDLNGAVVDLARYLPSISGSSPDESTRTDSVISTAQIAIAEEVKLTDKARGADMPPIRFRDYICPGLSKQDDDKVMHTSLYYLQLEYQNTLDDDCYDLEQALTLRKPGVPQKRLLPQP